MNGLKRTLLLFILVAAQACAAESPPPNIIFIFADDWGDLGIHGSEIYQTPNIDRLAAEDWYEANDVSGEHPEVSTRLIGELNTLRSSFPDSPPKHVLSALREQGQGSE